MNNRLQTLTYLGALLTTPLIVSGLADAQTPTFSVLYTFQGGGSSYGGSDGAVPQGNLVLGKDGVLYGVTNEGGCCFPQGAGTVFSLTPPTSPGGAWTETILFYFDATGGNDGCVPNGVSFGKGGVLYGTTSLCGALSENGGAIFSLTPPPSPGGAWTPTSLASFGANQYEGYEPLSGVAIGVGGALFGTTSRQSQVWALAPPASAGAAWTKYPLYSFTHNGNTGPYIYGGLVIGAGGVLYGTTKNDPETVSVGTVFSLTASTVAGQPWTENTIYAFTGDDGADPESTLLLGPGGVLYGTTKAGGNGTYCGPGCGVVFSLTPPVSPGGVWKQTVLYAFLGHDGDGYTPGGGVVFGPNGVLYGTTLAGGASNAGTVFELTPPNSSAGHGPTRFCTLSAAMKDQARLGLS